ncbi:hypothetical protein CEXT_6421 [Caerostris extrusa]|uniref:Uncharacterized protein n=1 Tax=Caerostris extrusa TaxID=172846 RepID=A0AAV4U543_CAEEX|nr:hypothetical protein CEXT_6421 [Caerostris extrusa]
MHLIYHSDVTVRAFRNDDTAQCSEKLLFFQYARIERERQCPFMKEMPFKRLKNSNLFIRCHQYVTIMKNEAPLERRHVGGGGRMKTTGGAKEDGLATPFEYRCTGKKGDTMRLEFERRCGSKENAADDF